jgi:phosphate transport system permease protein
MTEGIFPAIVGTLCLVLVSMIFAFLLVLAAIYMSEYVKDGWPKKIIKQMTNNLAGVPSIVFGLLECHYL